MPNSENVTTKFKVDISDLKSNIAEANRQLKTAQAEMKNATAGMDKSEKTVDSLSAQIAAQSKIVEAEEKKLAALKSEMERYNARIKEGDRVIADLTEKHRKAAAAYGAESAEAKKYEKQLQDAQKAQERNKTAAENLNVQIINQDTKVKEAAASVNRYKTQLTELESGEKKTTEATKDLGDTAKDITDGGLDAFAVALGNLAANVISKLLDKMAELVTQTIEVGKGFESGVSQIAATMGKAVDDAEIEQLSDKAKELGKNTQFSASQAAEGLNILAMAGLSADEQIAGIEDVLNLAAAGGLTLANSASYLTGVVNGFGDSIDNAGVYANLMAQGATLAKTNVNDLGTALSGSAANAKSYGQTAEGTTLSLLRLAQQGIVGSEAATTLNRAMTDLYAPTDSAKKALDALGVSAYDSSGNARDFNDVVADLKVAFSGMVEEEANATKNAIFTTNGLNAFNKMIVSSDEELEKFTDGLAHASDGMGSAADQAATMTDNLEGDLTKMGSAFEGFQLALYDKFSAPLRDVVQSVTDNVIPLFTDVVNGADGAADALGSKISEIVFNIGDQIAGALPTLLKVGTSIVTALTSAVVAGLPEVLPLLTPALADIIDSIGKMLPQLVSGAADVLPILASQLIDSADVILDALVDVLEQVFNSLPDVIQKLMSSLPTLIGKLGEFIIKNLPLLLSLMTNIINIVVGQLPTILVAAINAITKNAGMLGQLVAVIVESIPQFVLALVPVLFDLVVQIAAILIRALPQLNKAVSEFFLTALSDLGESMWAKLSQIGEWLKTNVWDVITSFWVDYIEKNAPWVPIFIEEMFKKAVTKVKGIFNGLKSFFSGFWGSVKSIFKDIGTKVGEVVGGAFKTAINVVISTVENGLNFIPNAINGALDLINDLPGVDIPELATFQLPRLMAKGGIAQSPVNAIVGEAGAEAVIPLKQGIPQLAAAIASSLQASGVGLSKQTINNYTYNFDQTNNSPKALSRWEIYRQTKNLLSYVQG